MQIIGKNIPNIQNQFSSTLDSVKTGINETAKVLGVHGLQSAFESFSSANIGNPGVLDPQSWVGNDAQFPDLLSFFANHSQLTNESGSPFVSEELVRILNDDKFQPAAELGPLKEVFPPDAKHISGEPETLGEELRIRDNDKVDRSLDPPSIGGVVDELMRRLERRASQISGQKELNPDHVKTVFQAFKEQPYIKSENTASEPKTDELVVKENLRTQPYEQAEKGITDKADTPEMYYRKEFLKAHEKKQKEAEALMEKAQKQHAFEVLKKQPAVEFEPNAEGPMTTASETKQKAFQALKEQTFVEADGNSEAPREKPSAIASKDLAGSASVADQRGIIIVGGKPQEALPGHLGEKLQTVQPSSLEWAVNLFVKKLQTSQPFQQAEKGKTDELVAKDTAPASWDTPETKLQKEIYKSLDEPNEAEAMEEELRKKLAFEALKKQHFVEADGNSEGPTEKGSAIASKDSAGSASGADQRGIIVVGGTPQDSASQRGIIIVGGKTDGTYYQTIDDTILELQTNPKPETLQLFGQQLGAVQDMTSTAKQAVLLQKQFTANTLSGKILS